MKTLEAVDVVIVGAGAAGSLLAAKLAAGGKKVVVLEAGPPWRLADLFSSQIWARRLKWQPGAVTTTGANPISVDFNSGGGLGGGALHHYANWYRLHEGDFREHSLYGENVDWPIGYDDLRPYYDFIQAEVGISGDAKAEVTRPPGDPYPMPPLPNFRQGKLIAQGFTALGMHSFPSPHAINSVEYKGRDKCINDGWCDAGCPIGALANPLTVYIPAARAAGAEFWPWSTVTRIATDAAGKHATGAAFVDRTGAEYFLPAAIVIVAAFAIQTPRLLLASATSVFPNGLANSSGAVGLYIMSHISGIVSALFAENTEPYMGVTGGSLTSQDAYDDKRKSTYFGSYQWLCALAVKPNDLLGIANTRADLFGAALGAFMQNAAHHIANMAPLGEARPLAANRVTLSSSTDAAGVPLPVVTHAFDPDALAIFAATTAEGMAVMKAAGATETWAGAPAMQHILGGAVMGANPATSVTNGYGQAHDLPNLFIAGSSLFPTSGAVNPTFTICALALRTADYLLNNWSAHARPA